MAGAAHCSLQAKRLLLDPKFEGYKLSLEPLACYQLGLDAGEEWGWVRRRGGSWGGGGRGEPAGPPLRPAARPAPWAAGEGTGSVLSPCSAARPSGPRCKRALSWGEPPYREAGGRLREPVFGLDFRRYDGPQRSLIGVSALRGRVSSRWTKGPDGCRVTARQVSVCPCEFGLSFQTGKKICVLDLVLACARVVRPEDRFKVVVCT